MNWSRSSGFILLRPFLAQHPGSVCAENRRLASAFDPRAISHVFRITSDERKGVWFASAIRATEARGLHGYLPASCAFVSTSKFPAAS
jgi:hypothetical protein